MPGPKTKSVYAALSTFLGPDQLERAVKAADALVKKKKVRAAICGGVAMQMYGSDRLTRDVDFLVDTVEGIEGEPLSFGGIRTTLKGVHVDFICRDDEYAVLYAAALNAAVRDADGLGVVPAEYMMAIKQAAARGKDIQDFNTLVDNPECDLVEARKIVKKYLGIGYANDFNQMVEVARLERNLEKRK